MFLGYYLMELLILLFLLEFPGKQYEISLKILLILTKSKVNKVTTDSVGNSNHHKPYLLKLHDLEHLRSVLSSDEIVKIRSVVSSKFLLCQCVYHCARVKNFLVVQCLAYLIAMSQVNQQENEPEGACSSLICYCY